MSLNTIHTNEAISLDFVRVLCEVISVLSLEGRSHQALSRENTGFTGTRSECVFHLIGTVLTTKNKPKSNDKNSFPCCFTIPIFFQKIQTQ